MIADTGQSNAGVFAFGAEMPCILPLVSALAELRPTRAVMLGVSWPFVRRGAPRRRLDCAVRPEIWSYPPGFRRQLAPVFDGRIGARLRRAVRTLSAGGADPPWMVVPYPWMVRYLSVVNPERVVYFNHDDYTRYGSDGTPIEDGVEAMLIERAGTILCNSLAQAACFRSRFPARARSIFHLPHGVAEAAINPRASDAPARPSVCALGALTGRYDWRLVHDVVTRLPEVEFLFVGEVGDASIGRERPDWRIWLAKSLAAPNVRHISGVAEADMPAFYWNTSVNWMPYDIDLRFVQQCSPLKLFTGLASGRPVISADVPECRLYPEWVDIYRSAPEAVSLLQRILGRDAGERCARAAAQVAFARLHTWTGRARAFLDVVERRTV